MLIPGERHQEVALLQQVLVKEGLLETSAFTDVYDENTENAVMASKEKI